MTDSKKEMQKWAKDHVKEFKPQFKPEDLPKKVMICDINKRQVKNQDKTPSCTSHAFTSMHEIQLSKFFKEPVTIDALDLWEKQQKYGTATDQGDTLMGVAFIADKYGMKFQTESGIKGIYKPTVGIKITERPLNP